MFEKAGAWGGHFIGFLQNSPFYDNWSHLQFDDPVIFQMRGPNKRSVAYFDQAQAIKEIEELNKRY